MLRSASSSLRACVARAAPPPRTSRNLSQATAAFDRAPNGGLEITFSPYHDLPELGFNRSQEFCMLTLQHPAFENTTPESRRLMYDSKREDRVKRARKIFTDEDKMGTEVLDRDELKRAAERIGLPSHEAAVVGMLQRHSGSCVDGGINFEEFLNVLTEAWGRVPSPEFHEDFSVLHKKVPGCVSIEGLRSYSWLGRNSPPNYALRSLRNLWPYALRRVAILQNKAYNPDLDPEKMTVLLDTYEGGRVPGVNNVMDLAARAAASLPTAEGGLVVRVVPTLSALERWPDGGEVTYVPLRGLPENLGPRGLQAMQVWWKNVQKMIN